MIKYRLSAQTRKSSGPQTLKCNNCSIHCHEPRKPDATSIDNQHCNVLISDNYLLKTTMMISLPGEVMVHLLARLSNCLLVDWDCS